jgi:iron-sulfur cluster assembly accessory protein
MYKQLAAVVSMLALASGCAEPTPPSNGDPATIAAPSITAPNTIPAVRERAVVNLTDSAAAKFKEFLAAEPTKHIRLSVKNEGPTGFMYDLQIDESINDSDFVDRSHGFALVVDPKSSLYLKGATIDWQTQPDGQAGFKFDNPNAVQK